MAQRPQWRTNDVVAYDSMRETLNAVMSELLDAVRAGGEGAAAAQDEIRRLRAATLTVDGYDRTAIDAAHARLAARLQELRPS